MITFLRMGYNPSYDVLDICNLLILILLDQTDEKYYSLLKTSALITFNKGVLSKRCFTLLI